MKQQTLIHSSILAAIILAAVIGVGMITGYPGTHPFISIDPVSDKNIGEPFTITGTTNLPEGSEVLVDIHPSSLDFKTGMVTDPETGAVRELDDSMAAAGMFKVDKDPDGVAAWSFDVPSGKFLTGEYTAVAFVYDKNKPDQPEISGTTNFTVRPGPATAGTGAFIRVNPVGDRNAGDFFTISGTTDLPAGTELIVQVYPASFEKEIPDTGEFSGAVGGVDVIAGAGGINTWSMDIDTSVFVPMEYLVNASVFAGDDSKGDLSTRAPYGTTTFTLRAGKAGTSKSPDRTVAGGILIDPIKDTTRGKPLEVTGRTNLSAGSGLTVQLMPVVLRDGKIAADEQYIGNEAVTTVVKGSGINNRFSVLLDTRFLTPADYIVTVSNRKGGAAGTGPVPGAFTGSAVFNIIAGTGPAQDDLSLPCIFINPFDEITAGDRLSVSGTTNVPAGSKFRVMVIEASSTDFEHPEISATVSAIKGTKTTNLFSATLPTTNLKAGQHILLVSAEDAEVTGSALFTVK